MEETLILLGVYLGIMAVPAVVFGLLAYSLLREN